MRARLKGLTVSLFNCACQMYEEPLALVFKGNAKEKMARLKKTKKR